MDVDADSVHLLVTYVAVVLGVLGPVTGILYALLVERRDAWRTPMLVTATLTFAAVVGDVVSGRVLSDGRPGLSAGPMVAPHLEHADRLLVPAAGFFLIAVLTGLLNPRTGVLRTVLPMLLTGFSVVVLVLVVLGSDAGVRSLLEQVLEQVREAF